MNVNAFVEIADDRRNAAMGATVLDVSESGLKLQLSREIPVGTLLHVRFEALLVSGMVRYCKPTRTGQFESCMQMSDVNPILNSAASRRNARCARAARPLPSV